MTSSIKQLLEHFELHESVVGLVADTTASSTGHLNGALVLLAKYGIASAVLYLLCRYHIYECHNHHVMSEVLSLLGNQRPK